MQSQTKFRTVSARTRALTVTLVLGATISGAVAPLVAQPSYTTGQVLRLTLSPDNRRVEGVVTSVDSAEIRLRFRDSRDGGRSYSVSQGDVVKAEISTSSRGHTLQGALIGAIAGGILALATYEDACEGHTGWEGIGACLVQPTQGEAMVGSALAMGGVGAFIGYAIRQPNWRPHGTAGTVRVGADMVAGAIVIAARWPTSR